MDYQLSHISANSIGRESVDTSADTLSLFGQQIGWYVGRYVSMTGYDMSVDMSIWHDMSINILLVWINRLFQATDLGFNKLSSDQKPSSVRLTYSVNRTQFVQFVGNRPCIKACPRFDLRTWCNHARCEQLTLGERPTSVCRMYWPMINWVLT